MFLFPERAGLEASVTLSISLEEGSKKFYESILNILTDEREKVIFKELVKAEARHREMLKKLSYVKAIDSSDMEHYIESGMKLSEALNWIKGKGIKEILDYSFYIETNSYDLYLRMRDKTKGTESEKVFLMLAEEEKKHLDSLTGLFEQLWTE